MGTASQKQRSGQKQHTASSAHISGLYNTGMDHNLSPGLQDLLTEMGRIWTSWRNLVYHQTNHCLVYFYLNSLEQTSLYLGIVKCLINSQEATPRTRQDSLRIHLRIMAGHCLASSSQAQGLQPVHSPPCGNIYFDLDSQIQKYFKHSIDPG